MLPPSDKLGLNFKTPTYEFILQTVEVRVVHPDALEVGL